MRWTVSASVGLRTHLERDGPPPQRKIGRIYSPVLIPIFCASVIITYRHYDDLSIPDCTATHGSARWTRDFAGAGLLARHLRKGWDGLRASPDRPTIARRPDRGRFSECLRRFNSG